MRPVSLAGIVLAALLFFIAPSLHAQFGGGTSGGAAGGHSSGPTVSLGGLGDNSKPPTVHDRRLIGHVKDGNGNSLKGATVHIQDIQAKREETVIADDSGAYRFGDLYKGHDYKVWATLNKKDGPTKTISQYDTRDELSLNVTIE